MRNTFVLTVLLLTSSNLFSTCLDHAVTKAKNEIYIQKLEYARNSNMKERNYRVDKREVRILLDQRRKIEVRRTNFIKTQRAQLEGIRTIKSFEVHSSI